MDAPLAALPLPLARPNAANGGNSSATSVSMDNLFSDLDALMLHHHQDEPLPPGLARQLPAELPSTLPPALASQLHTSNGRASVFQSSLSVLEPLDWHAGDEGYDDDFSANHVPVLQPPPMHHSPRRASAQQRLVRFPSDLEPAPRTASLGRNTGTAPPPVPLKKSVQSLASETALERGRLHSPTGPVVMSLEGSLPSTGGDGDGAEGKGIVRKLKRALSARRVGPPLPAAAAGTETTAEANKVTPRQRSTSPVGATALSRVGGTLRRALSRGRAPPPRESAARAKSVSPDRAAASGRGGGVGGTLRRALSRGRMGRPLRDTDSSSDGAESATVGGTLRRALSRGRASARPAAEIAATADATAARSRMLADDTAHVSPYHAPPTVYHAAAASMTLGRGKSISAATRDAFAERGESVAAAAAVVATLSRRRAAAGTSEDADDHLDGLGIHGDDDLPQVDQLLVATLGGSTAAGAGSRAAAAGSTAAEQDLAAALTLNPFAMLTMPVSGDMGLGAAEQEAGLFDDLEEFGDHVGGHFAEYDATAAYHNDTYAAEGYSRYDDHGDEEHHYHHQDQDGAGEGPHHDHERHDHDHEHHNHEHHDHERHDHEHHEGSDAAESHNALPDPTDSASFFDEMTAALDMAARREKRRTLHRMSAMG